ncbi:hypothetical protein [Cesiribacter sp. SM1]|nr:hypothetical protein [Cesiribacter sp. SM1]
MFNDLVKNREKLTALALLKGLCLIQLMQQAAAAGNRLKYEPENQISM